jgi:hypothetical protein
LPENYRRPANVEFDELRRTWPALADALAALDETLEVPVILHEFRPPPGP